MCVRVLTQLRPLSRSDFFFLAFKKLHNYIFLELIPAEAKKFFNSLTAEDRNVLKDISNKSSQYSTVDDVLNELKTRSSTLYEKAVGVVKFFRDTLDSLSPSARKFVEDVSSFFTPINL
jgi:TRAP-type C4-dicarboxylate transport system substrate-binding protein